MTTRERLLEALLVERYGKRRPRADKQTRSVADIRVQYDDDDLTTYARRKALDDACDGFGIPRFTKKHPSTHGDNVAAGQSSVAP